MTLFCTSCQTPFTGHSDCPQCHSRLVTPAELFFLGADSKSKVKPLLPPRLLARCVAGLIVGVGFFAACADWLTAALLWQSYVPLDWWTGEWGTTAAFVIGGIGAALAGLAAGAGRPSGIPAGLIASGLIAGITVGLGSLLMGKLPPEATIGSGIILLIGIICGMFGAKLWPAPEPVPEPDFGSRGSSLTSRNSYSSVGSYIRPSSKPEPIPVPPTHWVRLGGLAVLAIVLVMQVDTGRSFLKSNFRVNMGHESQAPMVTMVLAGFGLVAIGVASAASTGAGLRHGLILGVASSAGVLLWCFRSGLPPPLIGWLHLLGEPANLGNLRSVLAIVVSIGGFLAILGWFGGILLPPVAPKRRLPIYS